MTKSFICLRKATILLLLIIAAGNVWGADETLTLTYTDWSTGSYATGTTTKSTSGSTSIGISYTKIYQNSSSIQMDKGNGLIYSTSRPTTNIKIKSIKVDFKTNTVGVYGSFDGTSWTAISVTDNVATDVSGCNYSYFKVAADQGAYAQLNNIVVVYTVAPARTVSFNAYSGTSEESSLTEESGMSGVELPNATPSDDCSSHGWAFLGWATSECSATTTTPTFYPAGSTYYPVSNTTLHAVYRQIGSSTNTDTDVMIVESVMNTGWNVGGRNNGAATYPASGDESKTSVQLTGASDLLPAGFVQTKKLYGNVTAISLNATTNTGGGNTVTLSYSTDGSNWTDWGNTLTVAKNTSAYSNNAYTMTSFPTGAVFLRFSCSANSLYLYSATISYTDINFCSNPVCVFDYFIDIMHDKVVSDQSGTYSMPAITGGDASKGDDTYCDEKHYHFLGWVEDTDINDDGTLKDGYTLYPAGHSGHTAANKTYYAIWAKEE